MRTFRSFLEISQWEILMSISRQDRSMRGFNENFMSHIIAIKCYIFTNNLFGAVGKNQYVISRKLLRDTNSSYFKYICLTHKEKEKDMTDELIMNNELQTFKQILIYILTGSTEQCDYEMLKKLLTATDKYDVATLKLACEHCLLRYITTENAMELLQLAFASNAKFLEKHSATFIKFHIKEIRDTIAFKILSQEDLNKVLELIEKRETLESSTIQSFSSPPKTHKKSNYNY